MTTRPTWWAAAALIAPVMMSSAVWLCCLALAPLPTLLGVTLGLGWIAWRGSGPLLRWRFWVRPGRDIERDAVLESLVLVRSLRGRGQPRVLIQNHALAAPVVSMTEHDLAVSAPVVARLMRHQLAAEEFAAATVHAIGVRRARGTAAEVIGELYCLPWWLLAAVGCGLRALTRVPGVRLCWAARPVVGGIALVQSLVAGRTPSSRASWLSPTSTPTPVGGRTPSSRLPPTSASSATTSARPTRACSEASTPAWSPKPERAGSKNGPIGPSTHDPREKEDEAPWSWISLRARI